MARVGIDTLTTDEPAHVLGWVMQPISFARHRFPPDVIRRLSGSTSGSPSAIGTSRISWPSAADDQQ